MGEDNSKKEVELDHLLEPPDNNAPAVVPSTGSELPVYPSKETLPIPQPAKSKKRKIIFAGIIAGAILLLVGAAGAYYGYYLPNTPENVVRQALAKSFTQDELKKSGKLSGELNVQEKDGVNANISLGISKDNSNGFALNLKSYGVSADIVSKDGKTVYFKASGLKGLDKILQQYGDGLSSDQSSILLEGMAPLVAKLNDQWYEIDSSLLGAGSELSKSLNGETGLSQQDMDRVVDIYLDNEFVAIDKKGATIDVNGKPATEYQLHIDGQKLKSFVKALKDSKINNLELSDDDIKQINEFVDGNNLKEHPFSLWIDGDKNIVQFAYLHQFDTAKIDLKFSLSDTGADIKIDIPKNTKNIFELIGEVQPLLQNLGGIAPVEEGLDQLEGIDSI